MIQTLQLKLQLTQLGMRFLGSLASRLKWLSHVARPGAGKGVMISKRGPSRTKHHNFDQFCIMTSPEMLGAPPLDKPTKYDINPRRVTWGQPST